MSDDEFSAWLADHVRRCPHPNLPRPQKDPAASRLFFAEWRRLFRTYEVTRGEADAASSHLAGRGDLFPAEHLSRLMGHVLASRAEGRRERERVELRERAEDHRRRLDRRRAARRAWESAMSEGAREAVRAAVREANPHLTGREHFFETLCILHIEASDGADDGGGTMAKEASP